MVHVSPKRVLAGFAAIVALTAGFAEARETPNSASGYDPKAKAIIEKYIEVTGGKAAYDNLTSRKMTLALEVRGQNLKGTIEMTAKSPDLLHVKQEITGIGGSEQGFDGTTAWEKNPMTGDRLVTGDELVQFKERAYFDIATAPEKAFPTIRLAGEETFDGKVADKVELVNASGTTTQLYSRETGLLLKQQSTIKSPQGEIPVTMTFADYRDVDGIKVAHTMIQDLGMAIVETKITELKHNVEIDDSVFAVPAELKK